MLILVRSLSYAVHVILVTSFSFKLILMLVLVRSLSYAAHVILVTSFSFNPDASFSEESLLYPSS